MRLSSHFFNALVILALVSGCLEGAGSIDENGAVTKKAIRYLGSQVDESGSQSIHFRLRNTVGRLLCVPGIVGDGYHGRIDYFSADGVSLWKSVRFPYNIPILDWPTQDIQVAIEDIGRYMSLIYLQPGETLDILRNIRPKLFRYTSEQGGIIADGTFEGDVDIYAELEVTMVECDPEVDGDRIDGGEGFDRIQTAPFIFTSGRVGPFRVR